MPLHAKDSGLWKPVKSLFVKRTGVWTPVKSAFVRQAGAWQQFYSSEAVVTLASSVGPIIKNYFSAEDWANPLLRKRVIVPAGVVIGSSYTGHALATSDSASGQAGSWAGELIIENYGTISGFGGAANSGAGGTAFLATFPGRNGEKAALLNFGIIQGGGGGGGKGGTGGGGLTNTAVREPASGEIYSLDVPRYTWGVSAGQNAISWGATTDAPLVQFAGTATNYTVGGYTYYRGALQGNIFFAQYYGIYRTHLVSTNTNGGAGGNGGRGQGYDGAAATGAAGAAGGTNAGAGGQGGAGGAFGASGGVGATGANGNRTNGVAGATGGLAGLYINGQANVVFTNSGTVRGRVA